MTSGTDVSNPTTSSIPASDGSAIVKPLATHATTTSRAGRPVVSRYWRRAWHGWIAPGQVSLSVMTRNVSTSDRFSIAWHHRQGAVGPAEREVRPSCLPTSASRAVWRCRAARSLRW